MPDGRGLRRGLAVVLLVPIVVAGLLIKAEEHQMKQEKSPYDGRGNQALALARGNAAGIIPYATLAR